MTAHPESAASGGAGPTRLIALDWGTSALRAYRLGDGGAVLETRARDEGIMRLQDAPGGRAGAFALAFERACGDWLAASPPAPVLACGMVGSAQGWLEVPYVRLPSRPDALAARLATVRAPGGVPVHLVPGLLAPGALPGVMRGEETQVAGVLAARDAADRPGVIGLPGTHAKWVRVERGTVVGFDTFMTGEVYEALCAHTILGRTLRRPADDLEAFDRGLDVARSPDGAAGVLSTIFSARSLSLTGALGPEAQAEYLSGLLVGHELAGLLALRGELLRAAGPIALVGSAALCARYARAMARYGLAPPQVAAGATERGLWSIACAAGLVTGRETR